MNTAALEEAIPFAFKIPAILLFILNSFHSYRYLGDQVCHRLQKGNNLDTCFKSKGVNKRAQSYFEKTNGKKAT
jgi:hypothetical protein